MPCGAALVFLPKRFTHPRLLTAARGVLVREKVFCAIVAPRNSNSRTGWDAMVMYDLALNRDAQQYAREEPIRAARALMRMLWRVQVRNKSEGV